MTRRPDSAAQDDKTPVCQAKYLAAPPATRSHKGRARRAQSVVCVFSAGGCQHPRGIALALAIDLAAGPFPKDLADHLAAGGQRHRRDEFDLARIFVGREPLRTQA